MIFPCAPTINALAVAWVIFSNSVAFGLLRLLKQNFRHCFLLADCAAGWILYNPMSHATELRWLDDDQALAVLRAHPLAVAIRIVDAAPAFMVPWRPFTCVEEVKRVLGVRAPGAMTPWRLFRHLVGDDLNNDFHLKIG